MRSSDVVALVNSKDRLTLLKKALAALERVAPEMSVVVFDALSSDGSREWLERYCELAPHNRILVNNRDYTDDSFSGGLNAAAQVAARHFPEARFFFLYETDNELFSGEPLKRAMARMELEEACGAVGFTCHKHSGAPSGSGDCFPTWMGFALGPRLERLLKRKREPGVSVQGGDDVEGWYEDVIYTSPLLVRRGVWEELGGLDAVRFPFSETDVDLAWRIHRKGWKQFMLPTQEVIHDNQHQLSGWSQTRAQRFHEARYRLLCLHLGNPNSLILLFLHMRHVMECLLLITLWVLRRPLAFQKLRVRWNLLQTCRKGYLSSSFISH